MSYIDVDVKEGRRCAGIITVLAAQLDSIVEGASCELCHAMEEFSQKLSVLAADLLSSTEAYAKSGGEKQANVTSDGTRGS